MKQSKGKEKPLYSPKLHPTPTPNMPTPIHKINHNPTPRTRLIRLQLPPIQLRNHILLSTSRPYMFRLLTQHTHPPLTLLTFPRRHVLSSKNPTVVNLAADTVPAFAQRDLDDPQHLEIFVCDLVCGVALDAAEGYAFLTAVGREGGFAVAGDGDEFGETGLAVCVLAC